MQRAITFIFLALGLLLLPLTDRAQQTSPDKAHASSPDKLQASSPEAKPQAAAPAKPDVSTQEPRQQSGQVIPISVNLVDVLLTVLNRRNKLVPELEKSDFKIWDDKTQQEIRYFSKRTDLPLRIGMLLDTSNTIRDRIQFEEDGIEMAQRTSVVIYTISTSTQWISLTQTNPSKAADRKYHLTEGDKILQEMAEETGGRAFFPYHVDDLDQSFQDIGDELRNQYSIAYLPTNYVLDGRYHKIRIEVPEHKGY